MSTGHLDRRRFLSGALTAAAATIAGPALLSGCASSTRASNTTQANQGVKLPTYAPSTGVHPDLLGNNQGLLDAFLNYPDPPPKVTNGVPGKGGAVSAFVQTNSPVPPAMGQNQYWQELNRRLGVTLNLIIVPTADMATKFSTLVAGGDLPDIVEPATALPNGMPAGIGQLPQWLAATCQDLSEFLSGDAVKAYPFLAAIPSAAWKQCVYNGGIYGLPVPRGVAGTLLFRRDDLFARLGLNPAPASFSEFHEVCRQATDAKKSRWAITSAGDVQRFVAQMLGVPNGWRNESGKLVNAIETAEYKQSISDAATFWKEGLVHPDSFASGAPVKKWLNTGNALLKSDRYTAWAQFFADNIAGPGFDLGGMRPPRYAGGGFAGTWQMQPVNNFTALKKASKDRIHDLLLICNYLAAPFGSEEFLFRRYGIAGVHYTMQAGGPALTQKGVSETALGIRYIVDAPDVLFVPGIAAATRKAYDYQAAIIPTSVPDPTVALFSDTWSRRQAALSTIIQDGQNDIMAGRAALSSWDETIKQWRSAGGDQARAEFEKQIQDNGG